MAVALIAVWIALSALAGHIAWCLNRSFMGWFIFSLLATPIAGSLVVLLLPVDIPIRTSLEQSDTQTLKIHATGEPKETRALWLALFVVASTIVLICAILL